MSVLDQFRLSGKTALVTGCKRGIGKSMAVGLADTNFWLRLMGSSETILPYARDYMTIILAGMLFHTFAMSLHSLTRAEGNARVAMTGMIIGAVANIILDAIFIIPLGMGIKGAALATVLSQLISCGYFMSYYYSGKSFLEYPSFLGFTAMPRSSSRYPSGT